MLLFSRFFHFFRHNTTVKNIFIVILYGQISFTSSRFSTSITSMSFKLLHSRNQTIKAWSEVYVACLCSYFIGCHLQCWCLTEVSVSLISCFWGFVWPGGDAGVLWSPLVLEEEPCSLVTVAANPENTRTHSTHHCSDTPSQCYRGYIHCKINLLHCICTFLLMIEFSEFS